MSLAKIKFVKEEIINSEVKESLMEYSKNKLKMDAYLEMGEIIEEEIIKMISNYYENLEKKIRGNNQARENIPSIEKIHQFYLIIKNGIPLSYDLSWGHYKELIKLQDLELIYYYHDRALKENLSVRGLHKLLKEEIFDDIK